MKTASNELHTLIHSLTTREKAYISHRLRMNGGNSFNLQLFSGISKQAVFNEDKLFKKFRPALNKKKYIDTKNRLSYTILSLLENYHSDANANFKLQSLLRQAELLQSKGIYKTALQLLKKAQKLAVEQEKFEYLLMINRMMVFGYRMSGNIKQLDKFVSNKDYKEQDAIIEKIQNEDEYRRLIIRAELLLSEGQGQVADKARNMQLKMISNSKYLADPGSAKTILGKLYYYYVLGSVESMSGNINSSLNVKNKWLSYLKSNLKEWEVFNKEYLTTLANISALVPSSQKLHLYYRSKEFYSKIPSAKKAGLDIILLHHLSNIIADIPPEAAIALYNQDGLLIEKKGKESLTLLYYINMSIVFIRVSDFHSSIKLLNKIINYKGRERMNDIQLVARVFTLVCHYELENYELLSSLAGSYQRWIRKNILKIRPVTEIILMFKKNPLKGDGPEQKNKFFSGLKLILQANKNERSGTLGEDELFNFWVESKIQNRPLEDVIMDSKG